MNAFRRKAFRVILPTIALGLLVACARNDLSEPPVPLGDFALGLNIAVADHAEKVPISRDATEAEWEAAITKAVAERFGRYNGSKLYNIGISVDGYALAPPGIPVLAAPKSVIVISANIWDDAARKKLNTEKVQFTVFEGLSGETVIGTGLTRTREQQIEALSYNAVKRVEAWLVENGQWFGQAPQPSATPADAPSLVSGPPASRPVATSAAASAAAAAPPTAQPNVAPAAGRVIGTAATAAPRAAQEVELVPLPVTATSRQ